MPPFLKGLILGFSIAAPVGPIGLLCIRRSLVNGRLAGFVSGLGAATADALYGIVAATGLTAITALLLQHQQWIRLCGGAFLVYLGAATLRARPPAASASDGKPLPTLAAAYGSTLALTLTNPMTIVSFVGIFAGLGVGTTGDSWGAAQLVLGVFVGSAAWWLILSTSASWLGARLPRGRLRLLNVLAGATLAGFGLWQLFAAFRPPLVKTAHILAASSAG